MKKREEMTQADKAYNIRMDVENQQKWFDDLRSKVDVMNEFEIDFLRSVYTYLKHKMPLTPRMAETLENIYVRRT